MILKFVKYKEMVDANYGYADHTKVIYKTDVNGLDDVLREFDAFIKACGFYPKGQLQYVEEENHVRNDE